jgi:hypothetical protein
MNGHSYGKEKLQGNNNRGRGNNNRGAGTGGGDGSFRGGRCRGT